MSTTALVAKTLAPQRLPLSAHIAINRLPDGETELLPILRLLESHKVLENAVGVSGNRLYFTAHLGNEELTQELYQLGFELTTQLKRNFLTLHQLVRTHTPDRFKAEDLAVLIMRMRNNASTLSLQYSITSELADIPVFLPKGSLVPHLTYWILPGVARVVAVAMPCEASTPLAPSFDHLIMQATEGWLKTQPDGEPQETALPTFLGKFEHEVQAWNDAVHLLFPKMEEPFKAWSTSYKTHLVERWRHHFATPHAGAEAEDYRAVRAGDTVTPPATDVVVPPVELSVAERNDPERPMEKTHGDHQRPAVGLLPGGQSGVQLPAAFKPHVRPVAWQIPQRPVGQYGEMTVPVWAMSAITFHGLIDDNAWDSRVGHWLVRLPWGVELMTPEMFALTFNILDRNILGTKN
jgi:hypothetical protein